VPAGAAPQRGSLSDHVKNGASTAGHAANRLVVFSAPNPASTNPTAIGDVDRAAALAVRFTPPA
jgi:hypothetical protein